MRVGKSGTLPHHRKSATIDAAIIKSIQFPMGSPMGASADGPDMFQGSEGGWVGGMPSPVAPPAVAPPAVTLTEVPDPMPSVDSHVRLALGEWSPSWCAALCALVSVCLVFAESISIR
jgi:hypothetical protein